MSTGFEPGGETSTVRLRRRLTHAPVIASRSLLLPW